MKTPLIEILNNEIQKAGYISYDEMLAICRTNNYKGETGRRRLEKGDSPNIEHVMATKESGGKYVSGYRWIEGGVSRKEKVEYPSEMSPEKLAGMVRGW